MQTEDHHTEHTDDLISPSPAFQRSHSVFSVRDYGYAPENHLHYGTPQDEYGDQGPPWLADEELASPSYYDDDEYGDGEIHGRAIALFDFEPENDNEVRLSEGQMIWISYRHGQGWLVAEDENGETGLVPEEYVQLLPHDYNEDEEQGQEAQPHEPSNDEPKQLLPDLLKTGGTDGEDHESDWVDEDDDELPAVETIEIK